MVFNRQLLEGIRRGRIRCSVRIWMRPHVKVGGRYPLQGGGHVVVDSIACIDLSDVTHGLARESGFDSVESLLAMAQHGRGDNVYLVRFHYLRPGAWEDPSPAAPSTASAERSLMQRIRGSHPPARRKAPVDPKPRRK